MRNLNSWLFVTLDGVTEAPENFALGDDEMFAEMEADYSAADALLLGRRTYETFAASWPQRSSEVANADWMNNTPKYVASTTLVSPEWQNTSVIEGDVAEAVSRLKEEDGKNIMVNGSATLVRSLLRDNLIDELQLYVHPVVAGSGKRLFEDGEDQVELKLMETRTYDNGVVSLTYEPVATEVEGEESGQPVGAAA
jgi:dihydrofolate reductase